MVVSLAVVGLLAFDVPQDPPAPEPSVLWKERDEPLSALADVLGEVRFEEARQWARWGHARGYRIVLDGSARVLLLYPEEGAAGGRSTSGRRAGKPSKTALRRAERAQQARLELIARTLAHVDRLVPVAPETPGTPVTPREPEQEASSTHGFLGGAQREHLPVLVELRNVGDQYEFLQELVRTDPTLRDWVDSAYGNSGLVLPRPLLGAWLLAGEGLEEWSPQHELVNRLTRLLLIQRHGRLPEWISRGLAWQVEMALLESVYCFPRRDGFVFASEHKNWERAVRRMYKSQEEPLSIDEVVSMDRASFSLRAARRSWGVAEFLVREHPDSIAPLLADLAADRDRNTKVVKPDGTWTLNTTYEASPGTQAALLERHCGEGFLERVTAFLKQVE